MSTHTLTLTAEEHARAERTVRAISDLPDKWTRAYRLGDVTCLTDYERGFKAGKCTCAAELLQVLMDKQEDTRAG